VADKLNGTGPAIDMNEPVPGAELPALFANRFYVLANERTTRIAFGEHVDRGAVHYRTAITLPMEDAKQLVDVLNDVIRQVEAQAGAAPSNKAA